MHSKWLGVFSLCFLATACSPFLDGDKKQEAQVIELSDDRFACLNGIPEQVKNISLGVAEPTKTQAGFDCLINALSYFSENTRGSVSDGYTTEDMRNFFGRYFLKENNFSPELSQAMMKLKRALFGGSDSHITRSEIAQVNQILEYTKGEIVAVTPHMQMLLMQNKPGVISTEELNQGQARMRSFLQGLLRRSNLARADYGFEDLKILVVHFADFVSGDKPFSLFERVSSWVPLLESVRNVLIGRNSNMASQAEWAEALDNYVDLYALGLKYYNDLNGVDIKSIKGLNKVSEFAEQALHLMVNSHQMRTKGAIPFADIDELIEQLSRAEIFSMPAKAETLKEAYQIAVLRFLSPQRNGDSRGLDSFTKEHLLALQREFKLWQLHQQFFNQIEEQGFVKNYSVEGLGTLLKAQRPEVGQFVKKIEDTALERVALMRSWDESVEMLSRDFPVTYDSRGRVISTPDVGSRNANWWSLTMWNMVRSLSRLLMIGYADEVHEGQVLGARLSEQGLSQWYSDFEKLGRELKAFDERSVNPGGRSFQEASFFTFHGQGKTQLSFHETLEFVAFLFSGGLGTSNEIRQRLEAIPGCTLPEKDHFGFAWVREECFRSELYRMGPEVFANLPRFAAMVKGMSYNEWVLFYQDLIEAARVSSKNGLKVETADIRTLVMIVHYVENIFTVYDKDLDGLLSASEVGVATPRFMRYLKTVEPERGETILGHAFAYLVFEKQKPGLWDLMGFFAGKAKFWEDEKKASRQNVIGVFRALKQQLKPKEQ